MSGGWTFGPDDPPERPRPRDVDEELDLAQNAIQAEIARQLRGRGGRLRETDVEAMPDLTLDPIPVRVEKAPEKPPVEPVKPVEPPTSDVVRAIHRIAGGSPFVRVDKLIKEIESL